MEETQFPLSKDSRYAFVMAVARRARQIMREAQEKGVTPREVSLVKAGAYKPVKLAEEELEQGLVGYTLRLSSKPVPAKNPPEAVEEPEEEPPAADSGEENQDADAEG